MLNWLDFLIVILFVFIVLGEVRRGFGRAIFDVAALVIAVRAAFILQEPLTHAILKSPTPGGTAAVYAVTFVVLAGILLFLGKLAYDATLLSADYFDPLLGGVCGVAVATILMHALVRTIAVASGIGAHAPAIANSSLGAEFLTFNTYHRFMQVLYNFQR